MPCRLGWVCAVDDNLRTKVARVSALCCYSYSDAAGFHVLTSAVHQFDWMQLCLESKATTLYCWCATVVIAGGEEAHIGRASESIPIIINELVWWIRASRGREDDLDKGNCCENRQQSEQRIPTRFGNPMANILLHQQLWWWWWLHSRPLQQVVEQQQTQSHCCVMSARGGGGGWVDCMVWGGNANYKLVHMIYVLLVLEGGNYRKK